MRFGILFIAVLPALAPAPAQEKPAELPDSTTLTRINQAGLVFTAKVAHKVAVDTDLGTTYHALEFAEVKVLRGTLPAKLRLATRTFDPAKEKEPHYPKETTWLVATSVTPPSFIDLMVPVNDRLLDLSKQVVALPLGWTLDKGQPVSPWAALGAKAWPRNAGPGKEPVCGKCSRPALLAGEGIEITAAQVIPAQVHEFRNPYGDGQFRITVSNRGEKRVSVPALLRDGNSILWEDSLVIVDVSTVKNYGTACLLAGAGKAGKAQALQPVELGPKESVSTTINVLTASGVFYSPGGARYYYRFCLGEKSVMDFFYYHIDHHEPLRAAALKKLQDR